MNSLSQLSEIGDKEPPMGIPVQIFSQWTPNPNAFKFIVSEFVIQQGKATFLDAEECAHVPLAKALFALPAVTQLHFFENVITVTQDGTRDWGELADEVEETITKLMPEHNTDFPVKNQKSREHLSDDLRKIEEILDRTIRPGLQGDGGDVEVISLEGKILKIHYEGACGSCPSSMAGTLNAITSFIREDFDPEIEVVTV